MNLISWNATLAELLFHLDQRGQKWAGERTRFAGGAWIEADGTDQH